MLSKAGELLKQLVVVIDRQRALLQVAEFLTLAFNHALGNMMSSEISTEFIPSDNTSTSGILVLLEPFCSLIFELEGSELNKVLRPDVTALEMLAQIHKPIVSISYLNTIAESLWPVSKELVECSKVILIVVLVPLVALIALLKNLHDQLCVCIGCGHHSLPCLRRRWRWWRILILILILIASLSGSHPEEGDNR